MSSWVSRVSTRSWMARALATRLITAGLSLGGEQRARRAQRQRGVRESANHGLWYLPPRREGLCDVILPPRWWQRSDSAVQAVTVQAQAKGSAEASAAAFANPKWTPPKLSWGHPNLDEGNHSVANSLSGERAYEKQAAENAAKGLPPPERVFERVNGEDRGR